MLTVARSYSQKEPFPCIFPGSLTKNVHKLQVAEEMTSIQKIACSILIVMMLTEASCRRVIDRFPNSKFPTPIRCLIGSPSPNSQMGSADAAFMPNAATQAFRPFVRILEIMNCSLVQLPVGAGELGPNGSYDGIAGYVQRHEVDLFTGSYRTDFFSVVPAYFTTQGMPADVVIISRKNASYILNSPLLQYWASSFDFITVAYLFICLFLFLVVLTMTESFLIMAWDGAVVSRLWRSLRINVFKTFASFVDQENLDPITDSGRIIVLFYNLFLLFAVFGILFGSMGADLVVVIDPPVIESLDEFTNTSYTKPVILKQLFLMPLLQKSKPETELDHLKSVLASNPDELIVNVNASNMANTQRQLFLLLKQADDSLKALIIPDMIYKFVKTPACELMPDMMSKFRRSKKLFVPGILGQIMSLKIDPILRQVWNYSRFPI